MESQTLLDIKRIQSLTDALFAVAMTILILEIKVPPGLQTTELSTYFLGKVMSELFIYLIGFITLGIFWIGSHFHHHLITKTDRISSWLNILFLMVICLIPFTVGFLKNYRHEKFSIIVFSINLIIASLLNFLMLWYAWRKSYIKPHFSRPHYYNAIHRIFIPIYCYLVTMVVSFFSTEVAIYLFLAPLILHFLSEKGNDSVNS